MNWYSLILDLSVSAHMCAVKLQQGGAKDMLEVAKKQCFIAEFFFHKIIFSVVQC